MRKWIAAGRCNEVDGAAERIGAELQRIGALVDLDIFVGGRVDFLEVAIAVGSVDRNPVHVELDATQMEVSRQAGAPDRKPRVVAPFRLCKHAGNVIENILDGIGDGRVPVGRGGNDGDAARSLLDVTQRLLHGQDRQRGSSRQIVGDRRNRRVATRAVRDVRAPLRCGGRTAAARFCWGASTVTGGS